MTANELADALDNLGHNYTNQTEIAIKSATMLRQQQAEIEALKEKLIMEEESYILLDEECLFAKEAIKLHQAEIKALKAKTLTDMEILEIANKFKNLEWAIVAFARAILRKANEK